MPHGSTNDSLFVGGMMPTFLLTIFLLLSPHNSCAGRLNQNTLNGSSQVDVKRLKSLLDKVEASDEPALRIFLRLKIATYLWRNPSGTVNPEATVMIVNKALRDLSAHEKEIPSLYLDLFRRELNAQLRTYGPEAAEQSTNQSKLDRRTELEVAYSMLGQENGIEKAVDIMQRSIASGKDPGRIIVPFLHRLEKVNPAAVLQVLDKVVAEEEAHPGSISTGTLFTLKHLFIRENTLPELQRRYLAVVINSAGNTESSAASAVNTYTILADVLPVIEKQAPDLYYSASTQLNNLASHVPSGTRERISISKRVSQSSDPLAQLLAERNAVSDPSLRDDLQIEAAQLALEKGQIQTAIGLVTTIQPKNDEARLWRDQFIEGAVGRAIEQGNVAIARYGAGQIQSSGVRSSALQKVALYLEASNDLAGAVGALNAALELTEASPDSADKAVALLDLAVSFLKVDRRRASELADAAVKTINNISMALPEVQAGSDEQLRSAESMLKIAYKLIPAFQAFGAADGSAASKLAKVIQRQELSIAATVGVSVYPSATEKATAGRPSN